MSGYVLAMAVTWGLAYSLRSGAHVRIDVLLPRMGPRIRSISDWFALMGVAFLAYVITWEMWEKVKRGRHRMILGVAFGLMGAFFTAGMYVAGALGCLSLIIKAGVMPNGAIVLKENYTPEEKLAATTVMYKKTGYNPDHNDWYWLKVLADGTVDKEGMVMGCQECHGDVKDNDYIWTGALE